MVFPNLGARIKKRGQLTRRRIEGGNIGTFAPIAVHTSQCQVFGGGFAAVLLGNDVVGLVRKQRIVFVDATVFAATACSFSD